MKIISCNYSGNIPGIGRGPITNRKVSDGQYMQLVNMGFPISIKKVSNTAAIKIEKILHVQTLEEKRSKDLEAARAAAAEEAAAKLAKAVAAEEAKVEEAKVEESVAEESKVEEAKVEEPVAEESKVEPKAEEPVAEESKVEEVIITDSSEAYAQMSDEELEALVPSYIKRPVRYGRKWLLKTLKSLQ